MEYTVSGSFERDSVSLPAGHMYLIRHSAAPLHGRVALHYHDHYEAFFSLSGNLIYAVEGQQYRLDAGTLLLIAPYQLHQPQPKTDGCAERIALRFAAELPRQLADKGCKLDAWLDPRAPGYTNLLRLDKHQQRLFLSVLRALLQENTQDNLGKELAEQTLLTQFFLLAGRAALLGAQAAPLEDPSAVLVHQAVDYMEQNYASPLTLELLSAQLHMDRFHLSREFSRLVGCPPHRYLLQKRLQHVEQLLRAGVSPQQAAFRCGFFDYTNFYRQFRAAYGVSPRAWQTTYRADGCIK